jgi:hypothetical protein
MRESPIYSTAVLFGCEVERKPLATSSSLELIATAALEPLVASGLKLHFRSSVEGASGENLAPRGGEFKMSKLKALANSSDLGRFNYVEIYDDRMKFKELPYVYLRVNKMWGHDAAGYHHYNLNRPENNITVAVKHDLYVGVQDLLIDLLKKIFPMVDGRYGYVERAVRWGTPNGEGFKRCIIDRWHDGSINDYIRSGERYPWTTTIPYLCWANMLSESQFAPKFQLEEIKRLVGEYERHGDVYRFIKFTGDPQTDDKLRIQLEPYFNMVPNHHGDYSLQSKPQ